MTLQTEWTARHFPVQGPDKAFQPSEITITHRAPHAEINHDYPSSESCPICLQERICLQAEEAATAARRRLGEIAVQHFAQMGFPIPEPVVDSPST